VSLWVEGREVKRTTGHQTESMRRVVWDASAWVGKTAKIVIVDRSQAPWGVINVDDFRYGAR
jgi:fructan beta-fructosidase